jgi:hypothetical protein
MFRATEPAARAAGDTGHAGRRFTAVGRQGAVLAAVAAVALAAAACSSSPSGGSGTASGPIVFADVAPFSGPDAALGPTYLVSAAHRLTPGATLRTPYQRSVACSAARRTWSWSSAAHRTKRQQSFRLLTATRP